MTITPHQPAAAPETAPPDETVQQLAQLLFDDAHEGCDEGCHGTPHSHYEDYARSLLTQIWPGVDQAIREQVAVEIEAARPKPRYRSALPDFVGAAYDHAAGIARRAFRHPAQAGEPTITHKGRA